MLIRHATLLRYLPSIERGGLKCSKSKGARKVVWLHTPSESWWAASHTILRHGGRIEAVVIIEVSVPRSWLGRHRKGLWFSRHDIPPGRFRRVLAFHELAGAQAAG